MPNRVSEAKDFKISINVEQTVYGLVECVAAENNISMSTYLRQLIVTDLDVRGLLTKDALMRLIK